MRSALLMPASVREVGPFACVADHSRGAERQLAHDRGRMTDLAALVRDDDHGRSRSGALPQRQVSGSARSAALRVAPAPCVHPLNVFLIFLRGIFTSP
jgi:hypothetical protein